MVLRRLIPLLLLSGLTLTAALWGQTPPPGGGGSRTNTPNSGNDLEVVERLNMARREYQKQLEQVRAHYMQHGDLERARWAEEELRQFHRIPKQAFRLELVVPPETLHASVNIPEANKLLLRAREYMGKGSGMDYVDNQRRAELLLQQLITQYPQSNKIGEAAYQLGEIYEAKPYRQYRLSAKYYERCFQWNPNTSLDARLRAARLYDRQMLDRGRAIEIYREVKTHESDPRRIDEADKRLQALSGGR
jgi:tetratricopeptide (TPR) repeat protein